MNVGKTPVWQQRQRESPLPCKPTAPSYLEKVCVSFSLNRVDPWERDMERNPSVSSIHKGPWEDSKFKLLEEKELLSAPWKLPLELSNNVNSEKESNSPEKKKRVSIEHMKPKVHECFKMTVPISHTNLEGNHFHLSLALSPILGGLDVVTWLSEAVAKGRPLPLLTFPTCASTKLVEGRAQLSVVQNFNYYTGLDIVITNMRLLTWIQWVKGY